MSTSGAHRAGRGTKLRFANSELHRTQQGSRPEIGRASQSGTQHQRTELRPIAGPLRMKQRPSRVKGVTFVLPGDRGTRAPSPLGGRAGHGRRSAAAGAQRDRGKSTSSRKGTRNKTFSARAAALQRKTQVALDTQTQFLLASLGSHDEKRKAYMYRPERRHTSGRGQTFIAKRPGLLDVVRAYYMTPEQLKERDEADAKAKAKAKKADKALAAQRSRNSQRGSEAPRHPQRTLRRTASQMCPMKTVRTRKIQVLSSRSLTTLLHRPGAVEARGFAFRSGSAVVGRDMAMCRPQPR